MCVASLQTVLQTFEAQPLGDDDESSSQLDEGDDATFNIKYLTSSNLLSLEVRRLEILFPFLDRIEIVSKNSFF